MILECVGCDEEFHQDDCLAVSEEDGGPVCFGCLTAAEDDPELLAKLETEGVDLD
jgi:hypothetical protein